MQPTTDEEFESIPWDSLVVDDSRRAGRWVKAAAVGAVLLLALVTVVKTIRPDRPVLEVPTTVTLSPPTSTAIPEVVSPPLSEADLLAVDRDAVRQSLVGAARWFLTEYFTVDGTSSPSRAAGSLAPGSTLVRGELERSFVEAVSVLSVEDLGMNEFVVTAVVHALSSVGDGYRRLPPRGVELRLTLTEEGPAVVDLPRPLEPISLVSSLPEVEITELPEVVVEAASEAVTPWGIAEAGAIVGGRLDEMWRVQVTLRDPVGVQWLVALLIDDSGQVVTAGEADQSK